MQIFGCFAIAVLVFRNFGFPLNTGNLDALYLGFATALSSTVIIVKLLHDKRELDTLPGRITLGVLVLQDVVAILFLAVQPNLANPQATALLASGAKVLLLLAIAFLTSRFALPPIFRAVARMPELVLVGGIAWCFLIAGLAGVFHLSREMGALIAGVAISTFPYTLDIAAKLTSLRDFFVTLFFVSLGMAVPAPNKTFLLWAAVVAILVGASRLITVFPCLHSMRQGFRASLVPAINLAQISELSLVIVALGATFGHVSPKAQGVLVYSFVVLGVASTYAITGSEQILRTAGRVLARVGLRNTGESPVDVPAPAGKPRIFLLGFYWTASSLLEEITRHAPQLLPEIIVLDFNPNVNRELRHRCVPVIYGDITQRDTLLHAGIKDAEVIVCSLPNSVLRGANNLKLLKQLRELNRTACIIMHAELFSDISRLYAAGADYVSVPRLIEAKDLRVAIEAARTNLLPEKRAELDAELKDRNEVIP